MDQLANEPQPFLRPSWSSGEFEEDDPNQTDPFLGNPSTRYAYLQYSFLLFSTEEIQTQGPSKLRELMSSWKKETGG